MRLLPHDKTVFRMREYAIVENNDGTYEYVAWDSKKGKVSWIRGKARILGDILALTQITSEGEEEAFKTMKSLRKEFKKLPDWWDKTKYCCVVMDNYAAIVKHCITGKPLEENGDEFKLVQTELMRHRIVLATGKRQ